MNVTVGQAHRTLREVVADEIRRMISAGLLAPGERLFEDRLAEQLGVSRNPVREAIRALEGTGLVEVVPRRGAYVSRIDGEQVRQLLELRSVLEAYAAERAAMHHTASDLAAMEACIERGRKATADDDLVRAATFHREFHVAIERAARNEHLETVVAPLRHQTEMVFSTLADTRGVMSWDEHQRIYDAIADGQAERARKYTFEHMASVIHDLGQRSAGSSAS